MMPDLWAWVMSNMGTGERLDGLPLSACQIVSKMLLMKTPHSQLPLE